MGGSIHAGQQGTEEEREATRGRSVSGNKVNIVIVRADVRVGWSKGWSKDIGMEDVYLRSGTEREGEDVCVEGGSREEGEQGTVVGEF